MHVEAHHLTKKKKKPHKLSYVRNKINLVHITPQSRLLDGIHRESGGTADATVNGGEDKKGRLQLDTVDGETCGRTYLPTGRKGLI